MKGAGAGMVLQVARVTPALRDASGPLSIREAARLLNLSNAQVYNWMRTGHL
jgi:predicted DNA-binding transcriptional regulator AlpA